MSSAVFRGRGMTREEQEAVREACARMAERVALTNPQMAAEARRAAGVGPAMTREGLITDLARQLPEIARRVMEARSSPAGAILALAGAQADPYQDVARALLAAIEAACAVVVPNEPTEAMLHAGGSARVHPSVYMGGPPPAAQRDARRIFEAMLAASPFAEGRTDD